MYVYVAKMWVTQRVYREYTVYILVVYSDG